MTPGEKLWSAWMMLQGPSTNGQRRIISGLLTLAGTSLLACLLLEVAVRVVIDDGMHLHLEMWKYARHIKQRSDDQRIGHEHRPNADAFLMGTHVSTNRWGHRDREVRVERQPGVRRIVMLGDSFVEGWGVPLQDTVSKQLEQMFERQRQPVEVMNTGVGNYNTVMAIRAFLSKGVVFKPDMVVLNYTFNDAEPMPSYEATGLLASNSQAYVVLYNAVDAALRVTRIRPSWEQYYLRLYDARGWEAAKSAMKELAQYCRSTGTKLVIVSWPELHDVQNYRLQKITDRVGEVAAAEVVTFVDLLDAVKKVESYKLWVTRADPHPNALANALYAKHLFPLLAQRLGRIMPT